MITMVMYGKIRRMYFREHQSISEIARRTSLSRNTVKKWLRLPEGREPKYSRVEMPRKLKPFEGWLRQALEVDKHRRKRERRTAMKLFEDLREAGYTGGYSQLTAWLRGFRQAASESPSTTAFVPLKFALGEAFQFDWSEESIVIGGIPRRVQLAHLKLCASRAFFLSAYPSQGHEMLFDAHTRAFVALGGIPRRGIYDNMKTAVDRVKKGKGRVVNARFSALCSHYLFDADFCNVAAGWEKGVVEKNVQDSRRRIWQDAAGECIGSFRELNDWLDRRCRGLWRELAHPEYRDVSVAEALAHEAAYLMPVPTPFDGYVEEWGRVSSTCLVSVDRGRYSVPCEWAGRRVEIRRYPERVEFLMESVRVASHRRTFERHQTCYDWQHYIPVTLRKPGVLRNGAPFAEMPLALRQLSKALLRREGGDRVMAKVLGAVPRHGLEAVLVAVELVLESGAINAEHVMNVLARLRPDAPPACVETSLRLEDAPQANTARYDGLRPVEVDHA